VRLCTSVPMGCMNNKVYGFKVVVYEMSEKDKEILKNSENACSSGRSGGGDAMRRSGVPIGSRNNKVYGWRAVDYELSESDKGKRENASFPNET